MHTFAEDLIYGLRMILRRPGFAFVTFLALALGIGAVSAQFSLINGLLWKQPPFPEPERLVQLDLQHKEQGWNSSLNWEVFGELRSQLKSFEAVGGYSEEALDAKDGDLWRTYRGIFVTANLFSLLRVDPVLGRGFARADALPGAEGTALIGYDRWQADYQGSTDAIGRTLRIRNRDWRIVGVMPMGFDFIWNSELWLPIAEDDPAANDALLVHGVGRLRPDISRIQADAELATVFGRITGEAKFKNLGRFLLKERPLREFLDPQTRAVLWILMLMACGVLAIACFNVSNLLLARAIDRRRELAIRGALGASRWRVMRQIMTECLALAVAGGAGGLVAMLWISDFIQRYFVDLNVPRWASIQPDARTVFFAIAATLAASLLCGLPPALRATGGRGAELLQQSPRSGGGMRLGWTIRSMIVVQVALSVALLSAGGLTLEKMAGWRNERWAAHPESVFSANFDLQGDRYANGAALTAFLDGVLADVRGISGVQSAGLTTRVVTGAHSVDLRTGGSAQRPRVWLESVSPGFFETLQARLLQGRDLLPADAAGAAPVAVVNRSFVEKFWPGQNPIGRAIPYAEGSSERSCSIVGVVEDLHMRPANSEGSDAGFYVPFAQAPDAMTAIEIRADARDRAVLLGQVREAVLRRDPEARLAPFVSLAEFIASSQSGPRTIFGLINLFASIGLFLASLGVAGMTSFALAQRNREFAVRAAVGAVAGDLARTAFRREFAQLGCGLAVGFALAFGLLKLFEQGTGGVAKTSFAYCLFGAAAMLAGLALALLPSLIRILRMHPMDILREE